MIEDYELDEEGAEDSTQSENESSSEISRTNRYAIWTLTLTLCTPSLYGFCLYIDEPFMLIPTYPIIYLISVILFFKTLIRLISRKASLIGWLIETISLVLLVPLSIPAMMMVSLLIFGFPD